MYGWSQALAGRAYPPHVHTSTNTHAMPRTLTYRLHRRQRAVRAHACVFAVIATTCLQCCLHSAHVYAKICRGNHPIGRPLNDNERRLLELNPKRCEFEGPDRKWTQNQNCATPEPDPIVTAVFIHFGGANKHWYDLSRTSTIPSDYVAYCDPVACESIGTARVESGYDEHFNVTTHLRPTWDIQRVSAMMAEELGVPVEKLTLAAQRSVHASCRSSDLILVWLSKPFFVLQTMNAFPGKNEFAYVDAGFNVYRKNWGAPVSRYGAAVPPAPWACSPTSAHPCCRERGWPRGDRTAWKLVHNKGCMNSWRNTSYRARPICDAMPIAIDSVIRSLVWLASQQL